MTQKVLLSMLAAGVTPIVAYAEADGYAETLTQVVPAAAADAASEVVLKNVPAGKYKVVITGEGLAVTGAAEGFITLAAKGDVKITCEAGKAGGTVSLEVQLNDKQKAAYEDCLNRIAAVVNSIANSLGDDAAKEDPDYQAALALQAKIGLLNPDKASAQDLYTTYCEFQMWDGDGKNLTAAVEAAENTVGDAAVKGLKAKLAAACAKTTEDVFNANEELVAKNADLFAEIKAGDAEAEAHITAFETEVFVYNSNYAAVIADATNGATAVAKKAWDDLAVLFAQDEKQCDYNDWYGAASSEIRAQQAIIDVAKYKYTAVDEEGNDVWAAATAAVTEIQQIVSNYTTDKANQEAWKASAQAKVDAVKALLDNNKATGLAAKVEAALEDVKKEQQALDAQYAKHKLNGSYTFGTLAIKADRLTEINDLASLIDDNNTAYNNVLAVIEEFDFENTKKGVQAIEYPLVGELAADAAKVEKVGNKYAAEEAKIEAAIKAISDAALAKYNAGECNTYADNNPVYDNAVKAVVDQIGAYTQTAYKAKEGHDKAVAAIDGYEAKVTALKTVIGEDGNYQVEAASMSDSTYAAIIRTATEDVAAKRAALNTAAQTATNLEADPVVKHADGLINFVAGLEWNMGESKIAALATAYAGDLTEYNKKVLKAALKLKAEVEAKLNAVKDTLDKDIATYIPGSGLQKSYLTAEHTRLSSLWADQNTAYVAIALDDNSDPTTAGEANTKLATIANVLYQTVTDSTLEAKILTLDTKAKAAKALVDLNAANQAKLISKIDDVTKTDNANGLTKVAVKDENYAFKAEYDAINALYVDTLNNMRANVAAQVALEKFVDPLYTTYIDSVDAIAANIKVLVKQAAQDDKLYAAYAALKTIKYRDAAKDEYIPAAIAAETDKLADFQLATGSVAYGHYSRLLAGYSKDYTTYTQELKDKATATGIEADYYNRTLLTEDADGVTAAKNWENKLEELYNNVIAVVESAELNEQYYAAMEEKAAAIWEKLDAAYDQTNIYDENGTFIGPNMPEEYKKTLDDLKETLSAELGRNDAGDAFVSGALYTCWINGEAGKYAENNKLDEIQAAVWTAYAEYGNAIVQNNTNAYLEFSNELARLNGRWAQAVKTVESFYGIKDKTYSYVNTATNGLWDISGELRALDAAVKAACDKDDVVYNGKAYDGTNNDIELLGFSDDETVPESGYALKIAVLEHNFKLNVNSPAISEYKVNYAIYAQNIDDVENYIAAYNSFDAESAKAWLEDIQTAYDSYEVSFNNTDNKLLNGNGDETYAVEVALNADETVNYNFANEYYKTIAPALEALCGTANDSKLMGKLDKAATAEWNSYDLANVIEQYKAELEKYGYSTSMLDSYANEVNILNQGVNNKDVNWNTNRYEPVNMHTWMSGFVVKYYDENNNKCELTLGNSVYEQLLNIKIRVESYYNGCANWIATSEGNIAAVAALNAQLDEVVASFDALQMMVGGLYANDNLESLMKSINGCAHDIQYYKTNGGAIYDNRNVASRVTSIATDIENGYFRALNDEFEYLKSQANDAKHTYNLYVAEDNKAFNAELRDGLDQFITDCVWRTGKYYAIAYDYNTPDGSRKPADVIKVAKLLQAEGKLAMYLTQLASIKDANYGTKAVAGVASQIANVESQLAKSQAKLDGYVEKYTNAELGWNFDGDYWCDNYWGDNGYYWWPTQYAGSYSDQLTLLQNKLTDIKNSLSAATIKMYQAGYVKTVAEVKDVLDKLTQQITGRAQVYADNVMHHNNMLATLAGYDKDVEAFVTQLGEFKWMPKYIDGDETTKGNGYQYYVNAENLTLNIEDAREELTSRLSKLQYTENDGLALPLKVSNFENTLASNYKNASSANACYRYNELYSIYNCGSSLSRRMNCAISNSRVNYQGNIWTTEAKALLQAGKDEMGGSFDYENNHYAYGLFTVIDNLRTWNYRNDAKGIYSYDTNGNAVIEAEEGSTYWNAGYNDLMLLMDKLEARMNDMEAILEDADGQYKYVVGDVDADGEVTVLDYDLMLGMILQKDGYVAPDGSDVLRYEAADANGNKDIEVGDLTKILNIIRGGYYPTAVRGKALTEAVAAGALNEALTLSTTAMGDVTRIAISLNGTGRYAAAQLDITLPEGAEIAGEVVGAGAAELSLSSNVLANGKHRIVLSSINGAAIEGEGAIILVDVRGANGIAIDNAMVADAAANLYRLAPVACGDATAIAGVEAQDGIMQRIYNVGGQLMNGIKRGINIIVGADGKATKVAKK